MKFKLSNSFLMGNVINLCLFFFLVVVFIASPTKSYSYDGLIQFHGLIVDGYCNHQQEKKMFYIVCSRNGRTQEGHISTDQKKSNSLYSNGVVSVNIQKINEKKAIATITYY